MEVSGHLHIFAALIQGKSPDDHWIRSWVDLRTDLDVVAKRKKFLPRRESNPSRPARSLVTVCGT